MTTQDPAPPEQTAATPPAAVAETLSLTPWFGATLGMVVLSALLTLVLFGSLTWPALAAGWGLALANGAAAFLINRRAFGLGPQRFVRWAILGNVLRVFALLVIILIVQWLRWEGFYPFLTATLTGYFLFMTVEIRYLYQGVALPGMNP